MRQLNERGRDRFRSSISIIFCIFLVGCSVQAKIPSVVDDRVEALVRSEAAHIISVTKDRNHFSEYQFLLAEFPRKDIFGMSVGHRRIYISYSLASLALNDPTYLWLLRQTIAHEIAHEMAGHANQKGVLWFNGGAFDIGAPGGDVGLPWYVRLYNYSTDKELEADRIGLEYWTKLGWDCRIWVRILEDFQKQNYRGDRFHPTDRRLQQAESMCED